MVTVGSRSGLLPHYLAAVGPGPLAPRSSRRLLPRDLAAVDPGLPAQFAQLRSIAPPYDILRLAHVPPVAVI